VLGTQEQLAGVTFRRNNFHERDQVLTADLYAQTIQVRAYDANTLSATASLEKQSTLIFQKPWTYSFGIQLIGTQETTSTTPRTTYFIAAPPLRGAYDASDNLLDPTKGWRLSLRVSPEISTTDGTKSSYVKTQIDASIYQRVSSRIILAARTGWAPSPGRSWTTSRRRGGSMPGAAPRCVAIPISGSGRSMRPESRPAGARSPNSRWKRGSRPGCSAGQWGWCPSWTRAQSGRRRRPRCPGCAWVRAGAALPDQLRPDPYRCGHAHQSASGR
jgi:hypothetical protein